MVHEQPAVEASQVLGQIDIEISQLRAMQGVAGWSPWLLTVSIGTVLSLLAALSEHGEVISMPAACWFMAIWMVADAIVPWFSGDATRHFGAVRTVPFRAGRDFRDRRPFIVAVLLRYLLMAAVAHACLDHVSSFLYRGKLLANTPFFAGGVYAILAARVAYFLWSTGSSKRVPDVGGRGEGVRIFGPIEAFSLLLISLPGAYVYSGAGGYPEPGKTLPIALKSGVLLAALLYLVLQQIDLLSRPRLVERMVLIRRDLVSGRLQPQEALQLLEDVVPSEMWAEPRRVITPLWGRDTG